MVNGAARHSVYSIPRGELSWFMALRVRAALCYPMCGLEGAISEGNALEHQHLDGEQGGTEHRAAPKEQQHVANGIDSV